MEMKAELALSWSIHLSILRLSESPETFGKPDITEG